MLVLITYISMKITFTKYNEIAKVISDGLSSCLLAILQKKLLNKLSWNFQDRCSKEQGTFWGRLFHTWLDGFMFLKLGTAEVCTLRVFLFEYDINNE